jgi:hypothetical protein
MIEDAVLIELKAVRVLDRARLFAFIRGYLRYLLSTAIVRSFT